MDKNNIHIKKDKEIVDDGGHKPFGVDINPDKSLCHQTNEDGSQSTYYKGSELKYDDYVNELESRFHRASQGKALTNGSIGTFGGFGKGTLEKPYKTNKN